MGYFSVFTNCVACIIMALVIRLVFKLTHSTTTGHDSIQTIGIKAQTKMNTLVTGAHIVLTFFYTGLSILHFNVPQTDGTSGNPVTYWIVFIAWTLFCGFSDLFLTCMMFLILDEE